MDAQLIQQELRSYFQEEVRAAQPSSGWWENAVARATEQSRPATSFIERLKAAFSNPVWGAAIPVALVLIVTGALWATGVLPGLISRPASTTPPVPIVVPGLEIPLQIEAAIDKSSYLPGEEVRITLSIKNVTKAPFTLAPYLPEVDVIRFGGTDQTVHVFPNGSSTRSLDPGQTVTYGVVWDQRDTAGRQVAYGRYGVSIGPLHTSVGSTTITLAIPVSSPEIMIVPPQGFMKKTILMNTTVPAAEGTLTLDRVELTATEMKVYAMYTPQGYVMPSRTGDAPLPPMSVDASAEYAVDGDVPRDAGRSGSQWVESGIALVWDNLDPIPNGSGELTFRITQMEKQPEQERWQGPWDFVVPLR